GGRRAVRRAGHPVRGVVDRGVGGRGRGGGDRVERDSGVGAAGRRPGRWIVAHVHHLFPAVEARAGDGPGHRVHDGRHPHRGRGGDAGRAALGPVARRTANGRLALVAPVRDRSPGRPHPAGVGPPAGRRVRLFTVRAGRAHRVVGGGPGGAGRTAHRAGDRPRAGGR